VQEINDLFLLGTSDKTKQKMTIKCATLFRYQNAKSFAITTHINIGITNQLLVEISVGQQPHSVNNN